MAILISSQRYLDDEVVQSKRESGDYVVTVSPEFEMDGETYQAIIDGHHSLAAAELDGVAAEFIIATPQKDDRVLLLADGKVDSYLMSAYVDSTWYNYATKIDLF